MTRSGRLRTIGWLVIVAGVVGAAARYWIVAGELDPALDDTTALGYNRSLQHGVAVMMGPSGAVLTDISNLLSAPLGQALIVAACVALVAACFFRAAWVIDQEQQG